MNTTALVQKGLNPHPKQPYTRLTRLILGALIAWSGAAQAQLVDGGFDTLPLNLLSTVISGPTFVYGVWGQESSTLSTGVGPNLPASPTRMLSMTIGPGVTTQTGQAMDVSIAPYAALIASGNAVFSYSALFNADSGGPVGGLSMSFFSGNSFATAIGTPITGSIAVDNVAGNWELHTITGAIPVGTASLLAQVYYSNASLVTSNGFIQPGFVDSARLTISAVPEPGTWAMMGLGAVLVGWRHRRLLTQQPA